MSINVEIGRKEIHIIDSEVNKKILVGKYSQNKGRPSQSMGNKTLSFYDEFMNVERFERLIDVFKNQHFSLLEIRYNKNHRNRKHRAKIEDDKNNSDESFKRLILYLYTGKLDIEIATRIKEEKPDIVDIPQELTEIVDKLKKLGSGRPEKTYTEKIVYDLLESLGWAVDETVGQAPIKTGKRNTTKYPDIGLVVNGKYVCIIEVKKFKDELEVEIGRKGRGQAISYAMQPDINCPFAVLTDGAKYIIYNALAQGTFEDKRIGSFDLLNWDESSSKYYNLLEREFFLKSLVMLKR